MIYSNTHIANLHGGMRPKVHMFFALSLYNLTRVAGHHRLDINKILTALFFIMVLLAMVDSLRFNLYQHA